MIFSGPGIPVNKKSDGFTYLSDVTPTLYEYLGISRPFTVEARSLMTVIKDPGKKVRSSIYNVYGHWSRSLKTTDGYKLIVYNVDGVSNTQLFDLRRDPWETKDLSRDPAFVKKIQAMKNELKKEMSAAHDDLNIDLKDWGRKPGQKSRGS